MAKLPILPWTDAVRGAACLIVVAWHGFLTVVPSDPTPSQQLFSLPFAVVAREGVTLFILLSGYLLGRHWPGAFDGESMVSKTKTFMIRRCLRMLPSYWAALTLVIAAMLFLGLDRAQGTHWDTGLPLTGERVATTYLLLTDVLGEVPLSHQFWTVSLEFHLYLLAPLIVLLRTRGRAVVFGVVLAITLVLFLPDYHAPYFAFAFPAAFWLGARSQQRDRATWPVVARMLTPVALASVLLVVVALTASTMTQSQTRFFVVDAMVTPVFLAWLYLHDTTSRSSVVMRVLGWRWLQRVGHVSFSLYLIHGVMLELVWRGLVRPLDLNGDTANLVVMISGGLVASLAVAVVFFWLVEAPTMRASSRVGARRPGRATGSNRSSEAQ